MTTHTHVFDDEDSDIEDDDEDEGDTQGEEGEAEECYGFNVRVLRWWKPFEDRWTNGRRDNTPEPEGAGTI